MVIIQLTYFTVYLLNKFDILTGGLVNSSAYSSHFILYSSLLILIVFLLVMSQTRIFVKTRKILKEKEQALNLIEQQKVELELKDRNITDSLTYAQRIQEALLPSEAYFRKHFADSFILFKPKNIVSGDFYWIGEKGDKVFVVAADCTGHGVPGALMSMIGLKIIEKAINEDSMEIPSTILSVMNKGLEKTFSREKKIGTIIRDGMDIGLCVVDRKRKKVETVVMLPGTRAAPPKPAAFQKTLLPGEGWAGFRGEPGLEEIQRQRVGKINASLPKPCGYLACSTGRSAESFAATAPVPGDARFPASRVYRCHADSGDLVDTGRHKVL